MLKSETRGVLFISKEQMCYFLEPAKQGGAGPDSSQHPGGGWTPPTTCLKTTGLPIYPCPPAMEWNSARYKGVGGSPGHPRLKPRHPPYTEPWDHPRQWDGSGVLPPDPPPGQHRGRGAADRIQPMGFRGLNEVGGRLGRVRGSAPPAYAFSPANCSIPLGAHRAVLEPPPPPPPGTGWEEGGRGTGFAERKGGGGIRSKWGTTVQHFAPGNQPTMPLWARFGQKVLSRLREFYGAQRQRENVDLGGGVFFPGTSRVAEPSLRMSHCFFGSKGVEGSFIFSKKCSVAGVVPGSVVHGDKVHVQQHL